MSPCECNFKSLSKFVNPILFKRKIQFWHVLSVFISWSKYFASIFHPNFILCTCIRLLGVHYIVEIGHPIISDPLLMPRLIIDGNTMLIDLITPNKKPKWYKRQLALPKLWLYTESAPASVCWCNLTQEYSNVLCKMGHYFLDRQVSYLASYLSWSSPC